MMNGARVREVGVPEFFPVLCRVFYISGINGHLWLEWDASYRQKGARCEYLLIPERRP